MAYSPETMAVLKSYASSLGPTPRPEYAIVHNWHEYIQVPTGYLPIRIAQFSRGLRPTGEKRLYHWSIFVPTSARRGVGNYYEIAGSLQEGYRIQNFVNARHPMWDKEEKGTHLVGYVHPGYLERLETHIALVPVQQGRPEWNCQTWVIEALRGLGDQYMYAVQMGHGQWAKQMEILEDAWDVGNA